MIKVLLISTFLLCSAVPKQQEVSIFPWWAQSINEIRESIYNKIIVGNITHPQGDYYLSDKITANVSLRNFSNFEKEHTVELFVYDWEGNVIGSSMNVVIVSAKSTLEHQIVWSVPKDLISGRYYSSIILWEKDSITQENSLLIEDKEDTGFLIYRQKEEFDTINEQLWGISSKVLGRSQLQHENVIAEGGNLVITLPANTVNGGEIYTKALQSYGLYEASMKLPNAASSITGFFFYLAPDYYYEIDIEVFNDSKGTLYLTTYSNGKVSREYVGILRFNPTKDFHNYRMEYQEIGLAFYIDNVLIKAWRSGYPKVPMNLYINSWYPIWLEGIKPKENRLLMVDWLKY